MYVCAHTCTSILYDFLESLTVVINHITEYRLQEISLRLTADVSVSFQIAAAKHLHLSIKAL